MSQTSSAGPRRAAPVAAPFDHPVPRYLMIATALVSMLLLALVGLEAMAEAEPLLAACAMLAMPATLFLLRWPEILTPAVVFALYTNAPVVAHKFHGVPLLAASLVPMLLLLPLVSHVAFRGKKLIVGIPMLLLMLFVTIQATGALFAVHPEMSFRHTITFLTEGVILSFLIMNTVRTQDALRRSLWALVAAGVFMGALSVVQQVTGTFQNNYGGFAQLGESDAKKAAKDLQPRLAGPIGEKNYYAQVLLMVLPIALFRIWGDRSRCLRIAAVAGSLIVASAIALTFSRGAAVAFVLMVVVMLLTRTIKLSQVAVVCVAAALLLLAFPRYLERLTSLQRIAGGSEMANVDNATLQRLNEMFTAGMVFADHPVIGVGPGMFNIHYPVYSKFAGMRPQVGTRAAHNLYLEIAAENGILGLGCFLLILYLALRNLAVLRKQCMPHNPDLSNMATALLLAIVAFAGTGVFLSFSYIRYGWMIIGLSCAACCMESRPQRFRKHAAMAA